MAAELPYRELFESNPQPMWVYEVDSLRFLAVNDATVERYGWTRDEFLSMTLRDIRPPEDIAAIELSAATAPVTKSRRGMWRHRTKDGELLLVETASHEFECEGKLARIVAVYDMTVQETVRLGDERARLVARATTDAIWDWDLATDAMWWNEGAEVLFGATMARAQTVEDWKERLHPDDRERVVSGIEAVVRGSGDEWSDEYRYRRADGTYATVSDRGFVLRARNGSPLRMVGGMTDLTERRRLEAQMQRAEKLEGIGTLAGGIAHDLNNVLTPILMSIDMLRAHVTSREGMEILDGIEASTQRGADLVHQVLTYARGVSGKRASLAVATIASALARFVADTFPANIRFVVDVPPGIWPVVGDATQMQQVFMNLVVNARDALGAGGTVAIRAANAIIGEREAALLPDARTGTFVRVTVEDSGAGMPAHVRERIFEPFFTTKEVGKGTGLGLSMVQAIVRSHGGFVVVRSEPGKGTAFDVHLPADARPLEAVTAARRQTPTPGMGDLVLLVDDEPTIRAFAARLLERQGFRVAVAAGGDEAIAAFTERNSEISLVITDMMMPGTDGRGVIRSVQRIAPSTPIIAMSGLDSLEEGLDAGAGAGIASPVFHLLKPFSAAQLEGAIRRVLSQRSIL
ncbi:MAG: hybrid sensor histidine kinase/response regulator [Gemmatimonadaceae bacterium]